MAPYPAAWEAIPRAQRPADARPRARAACLTAAEQRAATPSHHASRSSSPSTIQPAALEDLPDELDPATVAQLLADLDRQTSPGPDREASSTLDELFHQGLLQSSGHGPTWSVVQSATGHLDRARRLGLTGTDAQGHRIGEHREVPDAVLAGDRTRAREAVRVHLRRCSTTSSGSGSSHRSCSRLRRRRLRYAAASSSGTDAVGRDQDLDRDDEGNADEPGCTRGRWA